MSIVLRVLKLDKEREKLIDAHGCVAPHNRERWEEIQAELAEIEEHEKQWVDVKDGLPRDFDDVLIIYSIEDNYVHGYMRVGYYHRASDDFGVASWNISEPFDNDCLPDHEKYIKVTHWMPLPEPPE